MEGQVITFEAIDTAGKSTQAKLLKERLEADGYKVVLFHFPMYERPIGQFIGSILTGDSVNSDTIKIGNEAMQMLYVADQLDFQRELEQYKKDGYMVILDRYDLSSIIYYSMMPGLSLTDAIEVVYGLWQRALLKPDLTIVLDLDPYEIRRRKENLDMFEKNFDAMSKASENYKLLCHGLADRATMLVDASLDVQTISDIIYEGVGDICGRYQECEGSVQSERMGAERAILRPRGRKDSIAS